MSQDATRYPPDAGASPYLLTIRGTIAAPSAEAAREIHNATAGAPPNVAGARAMGDLSHSVFVALHGGTEMLFIDVWNSLSGLGGFFANPDVQAAGDRLFSRRDPTVWSVAEGFGSVHLPVPSGRRVTGVGLLRTQVISVDKAAGAFTAYTAATLNLARMHGLATHSTWLRVPDPGAPATAEVISVDTWLDADAMDAYYEGGHGFEELGAVFVGTPDTSVWRSAPGEWTEW